MQVLKIASIFFLLFGILKARAEVPRSLALGHSTMQSRTFGGLCYSMEVGGGLPCNPAFITEEVQKPFSLSIFGSNNISYINDVKDLLDHEATPDTVERLFSQTKDGQMEVSTEAAYRGNGWGIAFTPFQMKYYSFLRNRALPQLTLLAAREENLRVQFGGYLESEGSWGVEIRGVNRKFVSQTASLTDTLAEGSKDLLNPAYQRAVYIEPGLTRVWKEYEWTPRLSMTLAQIGFVDHKHEDFRSSPELHVGGSVMPPVSMGEWLLGLDLQLHNEVRKWSDPIRLGSSYEIGITRVTGSFGVSDYSLGLQMKYGAGLAGIMYQSQLIENWIGEDEWVRTLAVQVGVEF